MWSSKELLKTIFNFSQYADAILERLDDPKPPKKVLIQILLILKRRNRPVGYPLEMSPIPRFLFTKEPMGKWRQFSSKEEEEKAYREYRIVVQEAGNLVNAAFPLRHWVLVDVEPKENNAELTRRLKNDPEIRKMFDVETRRGFHKLFYVPETETVYFKWESPTTKSVAPKHVIVAGEYRIELISGPQFLGSSPLQSRYLEYINGKWNVRKYKIISKDAQCLTVSDITPLTAKLDDIKAYIVELLKLLGDNSIANNYAKCLKLLKDSEVNKIQLHNADTPATMKPPSVHNIGTLTYKEFKEIIRKCNVPCLQTVFFGSVPEGKRYYYLRFAVALLPNFVMLTEEELEQIAEDFAQRFKLKKANVKNWKYWLGYDPTLDVRMMRAGIPEEVRNVIRNDLCHKCIYRNTCPIATTGNGGGWIKWFARLISFYT